MCGVERLAGVHLAATLLGKKTGSMFMMRWDAYRKGRGAIARLRKALEGRGVALRVLATRRGALVYAYRPERLSQDLAGECARAILKSHGYGADLFSCLQRRLLLSGQFPHEIGLFLGYPAQDVAGFIEHGGANYKMTGYWKVYHDVEQAQCLFCAYKQCRERMLLMMDSGMSLSDILCAA